MTQPMLLDISGGALETTQGYLDAGFEVWGMGHRDAPAWRKRFGPGRYIRDDMATGDIVGFDCYHCCPRYTRGQDMDRYALARNKLVQMGRPWVLEGGPGTPLRHDVMLCGSMFGLRFYWHRYFECNVLLLGQRHRKHRGLIAIHNRKRETPKEYTRYLGAQLYAYVTRPLSHSTRSLVDFYHDVDFYHPLCDVSTRWGDV